MADLEPITTALAEGIRYIPVTEELPAMLVRHISAVAWDRWDDDGRPTITVLLADAEAAIRKALGMETPV